MSKSFTAHDGIRYDIHTYLYFAAESMTATKICVNSSEVEFTELEQARWSILLWFWSIKLNVGVCNLKIKVIAVFYSGKQ